MGRVGRGRGRIEFRVRARVRGRPKRVTTSTPVAWARCAHAARAW